MLLDDGPVAKDECCEGVLAGYSVAAGVGRVLFCLHVGFVCFCFGTL